MSPTYSIFESNYKNIFGKKMKKNNFYKNVIIDEEESVVFDDGFENIIATIDYTDYDYFNDLMWDLLSRYSLYPPINTPSLNTIGKYM